MRPVLVMLLIGLAAPAAAQSGAYGPSEGNWGCMALVDNTRAGLLSIFAGSYGYASANYQSAASGTGNAEMAADGVIFLDGNLAKIGIGRGVVTQVAGGPVLTLYNPEKPVLSCTPR